MNTRLSTWLSINRKSRVYLARLTRRVTAFDSFKDLVNARGNYRPSLDGSDIAAQRLAEEYNAFQEWRGDPRRAFVF